MLLLGRVDLVIQAVPTDITVTSLSLDDGESSDSPLSPYMISNNTVGGGGYLLLKDADENPISLFDLF